MTGKTNKEIRDKIERSGMKYWKVADAVGITDFTFSRWLRHELSEDRRERVLAAIDKLMKERDRA